MAHEPQQPHEPASLGAFVRSMAEFILWSFRAKGVSTGPAGEPLEELAWKTLRLILEPVKGNRGPDTPFTFEDQVAVMDAVVELHMRAHHGPGWRDVTP